MADRWRVALWSGALAVIILLGAATTLGSWAWRTIHEPFQGYNTEEVIVDVPRGSGAGAILESLESAGVLADAELARLFLIYRMMIRSCGRANTVSTSRWQLLKCSTSWCEATS
jgi:cell division protein YceG involved in septum cleavage